MSTAGDPLERLALVIEFELFRPEAESALARADRAKGGRPPYDPVLYGAEEIEVTREMAVAGAAAAWESGHFHESSQEKMCPEIVIA